MTIPFESGQFVSSSFPFHEKPSDPGPIEHIAYIAGIIPIRGRPHVTAVSIYTTTPQVRAGEAVPIGLIPVPEEIARRMNQSPSSSTQGASASCPSRRRSSRASPHPTTASSTPSPSPRSCDPQSRPS